MPRWLPVLLALLAGPLRAQPEAPTAERFVHLGVEDGLSQSTVTAIAQDRDGFLWFGTDDGLNRYDGPAFTVFRHRPGDPASLLSSRVMHLLVDRAGTLWVATQGGLQWLDRRTGAFHTAPGGPGTPGSACGTIASALAETPDGTLWSGALTGELCRRPPGAAAFARVFRTDRPDVTSVQALLVLPDGALWVNGRPATCVVAPGASACVPEADGSLPIHADAASGLIGVADVGAAVSSQLLRRRGGRWAPLATFERARVSIGPQVAARVGDALWVGTEGSGVLVVDPETGAGRRVAAQATLGSGFLDGTVRAIFRDRDGAVWLGTTGGVSRWHGRDGRFELYRARPGGLSAPRVNGLLVARDGHVWIATNDGLNRLDPRTGAFRVYRRRPSERSVHTNAFWRVLEDARGRLVVSSRREGLFVVDTASGAFRRDAVYTRLAGAFTGRPERASIRFLGLDGRGRTWAGTVDGAAVLDPATGALTTYRSGSERLPAHRVNVLYPDRAGAIWAGTDAGVCRLDDAADRFRCLTRDDGLGAEVAWTLAETDATPGVVWAGTFGGGLCAIDTRTLRPDCLTTEDGLASDVLFGILPDAAGALWLTTTSGLVRFDPATGRSQRFSEADGLQSNEFDLMAFAQGADGWMVVGGRRGFNRFHPGRLGERAPPPDVRFTSVSVLGRARPGLPASGDTLRLGHDEAVFEVAFAALAYGAPLDNRYRYRLAGHDAGWREADGRRPLATYSRVPPGRYTFEVHGATHDGAFSEAPARLHVEVRPAWWQRADLRLLGAALLLGGLGVGIVGTVLRRERRAEAARAEHVDLQRRLAESRERERYRIARDLHDGPVQGLYRLGHQLDRAALRGDPDKIQDAREQVNAVADELRQVLQALRPPIIEQLGVGPALRSLARAFARAHPATTVADRIETDGQGWPVEVQHVLYRVAQEALANVARHADASAVAVRLAEADGWARLTVEDDGRGFAPPAALVDLARADHFGLVGLHERVESVHGRASVDSAPGRGTRVVADLPLTAARPAPPAGDGWAGPLSPRPSP